MLTTMMLDKPINNFVTSYDGSEQIPDPKEKDIPKNYTSPPTTATVDRERSRTRKVCVCFSCYPSYITGWELSNKPSGGK